MIAVGLNHSGQIVIADNQRGEWEYRERGNGDEVRHCAPWAGLPRGLARRPEQRHERQLGEAGP